MDHELQRYQTTFLYGLRLSREMSGLLLLSGKVSWKHPCSSSRTIVPDWNHMCEWSWGITISFMVLSNVALHPGCNLPVDSDQIAVDSTGFWQEGISNTLLKAARETGRPIMFTDSPDTSSSSSSACNLPVDSKISGRNSRLLASHRDW